MLEGITLYIPCYNPEPYLARVLDAVFNQSLRPAEVIVVDDASSDRSAETASRFPVRVIRHESNRGLSAARNTAMRAAHCELVAALDSDVVPDSAWLERLTRHFDSPKLALCGGKLVESVDRRVADRWRAVHLCQHWGDAPIENPGFVFGANTLGRRSALLDAGGYDERLRTNGEDVDLSKRLGARGWNTYYDPAAVCRHLRQDSVLSALTTFWRYRRDFFGPMTPHTIWRQFRYQHIGSAGSMFVQDWRAHRYEFLGMDALLLPLCSWNDAKLWRSAAPAPQQEVVQPAKPSREVSS